MAEVGRILAKSVLLSPPYEGDRASSRHARRDDGELFVPCVLSKLCQLAARTVLVLLGCGAVAWGTDVLPGFVRQAPIERVANHVIAGDPYKAEVLAAFLPHLETTEQARECRPIVLHSAAVIQTRIAERAIIEGEDIDLQLIALRESIRRSLACTPADPFLWVVLYWVEMTRNGFQSDYLRYLRLSYQQGPNEGWIALKRNRYALAIYEQLPPDIAQMAISEFVSLLTSGFYASVIAIFEGPGWSERTLLLSHLKDVPENRRQVFANALYRDGYDVIVPGIAPRDPRPWD